ncbi:MAG: hypothetical protein TR69_WS6001001328 [candidate division WS6 bacterium OLB20]|uniref:DUF304 domain-containing protein n=1 Tax=candidate division WS6 bacterium OLB20 TaxID=1617426 RepID=A0A136LWK9_9BACT|nr:MAG: hypothetical protein TR69_WS6001001328 [candidate division WS6 bacterium OLB20]
MDFQKKPAHQKKLISRQDWDERQVPVNLSGARMVVTINLAVIIIISVASAAAALTFAGEIAVLLIGVIFIAALLSSATLIITHLSRTMIGYTLKSGKIVTFNNEVLENIQGKVIVTRFFVSMNIRHYGVSEFDRVSVAQPLLGRFLNYGTVIMEQVKELSQTRDVRLPYIRDPEKYAKIIQELIDLEKKGTQPFSGMMGRREPDRTDRNRGRREP